MSTTDTRAAFEAWHMKEFGYVDLGYSACDEAEKRWLTWQAATEAAKAAGTAGEIDADAEMAKVKRDVELMGVGFLVDGKRCSLDRITWFNRPGDTWLPPPPGYPTEAARQPAPVLSDEQIDHIARSYFADGHGQTKAKGVIHDALVNARVLRPDHRETLEQIAHFLHNSVRIQQNAPDDYYPATEFDSQLQQAADEIGSILAATNRSQP